MARRKNKEPSARHVSVTTVLGLLAKVLGVRSGPEADLFEIIAAYRDMSPSLARGNLIGSVTQIYPWVVENLPAAIMEMQTTPVVEEAVSQPGQGMIVKDNSRSSTESLWLVIADPSDVLRDAMKSIPNRGLRHTYEIAPGDHSEVIAIQMKFCSW